jgi:diguanylate cyclase (GGDEF)-like protein
MSVTKKKLSKIREEASRLFSLESGIMKSVSVVNLAALLGVIYLSVPKAQNNFSQDRFYLPVLVLLAVFVGVNYVQQHVLMRLRRKWMELERQSTRDGLTSAFNRETFEEIMEEEMSRSRRYQFPLSLCIIDIDNFKSLNDTFGHPRGDRLLIDFVDRIQKAIRSADCLARYGGDEFCILLPHTDLGKAEKFLNRILLEAQEWLDCTFSAGVTVYRGGEDKISLISRADHALYQAKREGKNRIRCMIGEDDSQVVLKF